MRWSLLLLMIVGILAYWQGSRWLQRNPQLRGAVLNWLWVTGLIVVTLFLLARGYTSAVFLLLGIGLPLAQRWYHAWQQLFPGQHSGQSEVTTRFLRMQLDHATGAMQGIVLTGAEQGHSLASLTLAQLHALLRDYQQNDAESAKLLTAYLDRQHPHWHDSERAHTGRSGSMSHADAYAILGLSPGASSDAIRAAHRRLMQRMHPDRGGSDYLAAQINQAKDVLLGK
jgi:hypothetical protein